MDSEFIEGDYIIDYEDGTKFNLTANNRRFNKIADDIKANNKQMWLDLANIETRINEMRIRTDLLTLRNEREEMRQDIKRLKLRHNKKKIILLILIFRMKIN